MLACCGCTKAGCYQDKEAIVYYVGSSTGSKIEPEVGVNEQRFSDPSDDGLMAGGDQPKLIGTRQ